MRPVVVFDTNILLSALLSPTGAPFRCVAMAKLGIVESITCEAILDEFREKLENNRLRPIACAGSNRGD